jgi:hypothetical protein
VNQFSQVLVVGVGGVLVDAYVPSGARTVLVGGNIQF